MIRVITILLMLCAWNMHAATGAPTPHPPKTFMSRPEWLAWRNGTYVTHALLGPAPAGVSSAAAPVSEAHTVTVPLTGSATSSGEASTVHSSTESIPAASTLEWKRAETITGDHGQSYAYDVAYPTIASEETRAAIRSPGRKALVIGRGNLQGVDESRIPLEQLKGLKWFFLDPLPHHQDPRQPNCLQARIPIEDQEIQRGLLEAFDVVLLDQGVIQYIASDEESGNLMRQRFSALSAEPDMAGKKAIKESYALPLYLASSREAEQEARMLQEIFKFVKPGGSLMLPKTENPKWSKLYPYLFQVEHSNVISHEVTQATVWRDGAESTAESIFLPDHLAKYNTRETAPPKPNILFEIRKPEGHM